MSLRILFIFWSIIAATAIEIQAQVSIVDIQPANGTPGNEITLWGVGLSSGLSENKVSFIPVEGGAGTVGSNRGLSSNLNISARRLTVRIPEGLSGGNYRIAIENTTSGTSDTLSTLFPVTTGGGDFGELSSNKSKIVDLSTDVAVKDINGDGFPDLVGVVANSYVDWYEHDGLPNPSFSRHNLISSSYGNPTSLHVADVDGDGDLDIVGAFRSSNNTLYWFENDGAISPSFTMHVAITDLSEINEIDSRDMDNDGDLDFVAITDSELLLFTNDGGATPGFSKTVLKTLVGYGNQFRSLLIFDNDFGYRMNIITGQTADTIAIHKNLGGGSFDIDHTLVSTSAEIVSDLAAADVGYGSRPDIISSSSSFNSSKIAWYNSAGSYSETQISSLTNRPESIFAGDFDGDGDVDIITNSRLNGQLIMYESNGASTSYFTERIISTNETGGYDMTAADLDGDGDLDIITPVGGGTFWHKNMNPPMVSNSVEFDGDGDQILVAAHDGLDLTNGFTIEGWIHPRTLDENFQRLISKYYAYGFGVNENTIRFTTYGVRDYNLSYSIKDSAWTHIAAVMDASNTVTFYVNGEDVGEITTTAGPAQTSDSDLYIGNDEFDNESFNGWIDEVRIWNDVRTEEEIQTYLYQNLTGAESGILAYYHLDGSSTLDFTANTFDGTLQGNASFRTKSRPYGTIIAGDEGWRMMSSAVSGASYGEILDSLWTQGFTGADYTDGLVNVLAWDESLQSFSAISSASEIPEVGQGFLVYVFDDDDFDGTADGFPKTIASDSSQNAGDISPTLTYTDSGTLADDGWNLVGNPFGATIDWDVSSGFSSGNLDASFYVWSDSANGGSGDYLSWNGSTGTFGGGEIAPWQGFWVKANDANPSLNIKDAARSSGGILRKKMPVPQLQFALIGEELRSKAIIMFSDEAQAGKDALDAYKLQSLNTEFLSLYSVSEGGTGLDINSFPLQFEEELSIDLDMDGSNLNGDFVLHWEVSAIPEDWEINIRDNETGEVFDLNNTDSFSFTQQNKEKTNVQQTDEVVLNPIQRVIQPEVIKAKQTGSARFTVIISTSVSVSNELDGQSPTDYALHQNYPNPFNPSTVIIYQLPVRSEVRLQVFDLMGRKVATLVDGNVEAGNHQVQFNAGNLASGMYIYRLQAGSHVFTNKLTLVK